jgi:hypothetical protein
VGRRSKAKLEDRKRGRAFPFIIRISYFALSPGWPTCWPRKTPPFSVTCRKVSKSASRCRRKWLFPHNPHPAAPPSPAPASEGLNRNRGAARRESRPTKFDVRSNLSRMALPSWRLSETGRWRSRIAVQAAAVMQPDGCFSPAVLFLPEHMRFDSAAWQT